MAAWTRLRLADGSTRNFDIHPLHAGQAPLIERISRYDSMVIGLGKNGKLYGLSGRIPTGNVSYGSVGHSFIAPMARCLHSLKLITKEDLKAAIKADDDFNTRRNMEWAAKSVQKDLTRLGVSLTVAQKKKIAAKLKSVGSKVVLDSLTQKD